MLNYIGVFLTFRCHLACDYCINRAGEFRPRPEIDSDEWMKILGSVQTRMDLPITLQGGEPTQYEEFYELVQKLHDAGKPLDLLTNGYFDTKEFLDRTTPDMFRSGAPYASIRFSLHKNTDGGVLMPAVLKLQDAGYSVGVWGLDHPDMKERNEWAKEYCKKVGVDFRMKEFLDETHGTYKYPEYMTGKIARCICKSSEMLFAPDGQIHRCHRDLYEGRNPGCSPLDSFQLCLHARCNPCDVKTKTNRLQQGGHCSVEIQAIKNCKGY
jgi:hypothetical protein